MHKRMWRRALLLVLTAAPACLLQPATAFTAPTCQSFSRGGMQHSRSIVDSRRVSAGPPATRPPSLQGASAAYASRLHLHTRPYHYRSTALRALSTPPAAEFSSEQTLRELNRLLDAKEAELVVREAAGMEGDCVAHLRCTVFGQGKDMYRSQRQKMRTSPHYLLAGIYKTTLMVAVVRALTPKARQVCKDVLLADMQQLLDQAWISNWEHSQLLVQLEYEWETKSELVVGSVDCSVHEMLDASLTLRRWVYVSSMAVRDQVRNRGIGEQLLTLAVAHARKIFGVKQMFLHVEELNAGALRLYQRSGFVRGDVDDAHMQSMDRMLRLVLQVPQPATLYTRRLSQHSKTVTPSSSASSLSSRPPPVGTKPQHLQHLDTTTTRSTKMHHIASALADKKAAQVHTHKADSRLIKDHAQLDAAASPPGP